MQRNPIFRRFLAISAASSSLVLGFPAFAQPTTKKPTAPAAPKSAPPASPAGSAAAAPTPPPAAPTEQPAKPPTPRPEQPAAAPEVPVQPPNPAPELVAQWQAVYERGKAALAAGAFPIASRMLNDVAMRAPDAALREKARELAQLASYWAYNRLALMPAPNTLPPNGKPPANLEDKRSIDELAILYGNTLVWGTGFGMVIGFGSDNPSAASFILPAIGMSALGVGSLALMDLKFGPLPYGVPQSITSGMYMGLEAGLFTVAILEEERAVTNEGKILPGLIWGSATAGALVGGLVGATVPVTPGRASFTSTGAIWGGALTSLVTVGVMGNDFQSAPFVTGLIGAAAGGVTTGILGQYLSPSIARVRFIDVGTFAGGLVFGGLYAAIADYPDPQVLSFLTSAGIVAGLATSMFLTRDMDRDEPRRGNERKPSAFRAAPFMTPQPGGGTLGFAGTF